MPGYTHYYNYREKKRGGGVSIFVHNCLTHTLLEDLCEDGNHYLWVHINKYSLDIGVIYRAPKTNNDDFLEKYSLQLLRRKRAIVIGDFNYDLLAPNKAVSNYKKMLLENGHTILNKIDPHFCTRDAPTRKSILDHVSSSLQNHQFHLSIIQSSMSDHNQIYLEIGKYMPQVKKKKYIKESTINHFTTQ